MFRISSRIKKVVLNSIFVIVILSLAVPHAHAYNASAHCWTIWPMSIAGATINNGGLINGAYNVYARVITGRAKAGAFATNYVFAWVADAGGASHTPTASSWVSGYDATGTHRFDNASCP